MSEEDAILLECLEDVYHTFAKALKKAQKIRSIHVRKFEQILDELRSDRRVFVEISIPARLSVEQRLESQFRVGQVALEAEYLRHPFTGVEAVKAVSYTHLTLP